MHTHKEMLKRQAAFSLLGIALLIGGSLTSASAQSGSTVSGQNNGTTSGAQSSGTMSGGQNSSTMRGSRHGRSSRMMSQSNSSSHMTMMDDSSGFSNLYRGLGPENEERLREVFAENKDRMFPNEEDPVLIDPAPWNYPSAAPGAIDALHFTDYTQNFLVQGSVEDSRYRKAQILMAYTKMQMRRARDLRQQMIGTSGSMSGSGRMNGTMNGGSGSGSSSGTGSSGSGSGSGTNP